MNTLQFYPEVLRKQYIKNMRNAGITHPPAKYHNMLFLQVIVLTVIISTFFFFFDVKIYYSILVFFFLNAFFYFKISMQASSRIKKMEDIFPDVISLMASNLRSGITIDKAFLMAAKPEFYPLDQEILKTGKDITTGQDIVYALKMMSDRISSERIEKIILLIVTGLKAGGNISDLLEQTASNMKKKELLEKKSRSTILMYVIFIFFAVGVGAPVLFGLSSVLVEIIIEISSRLPEVGTTQTELPFTFSEISVSLNFVIYFAVVFMIISDLISSLVIGLVRKGDSKTGLRYFLPLVALSISLFFIVRTFLSGVMLDLISGV